MKLTVQTILKCAHMEIYNDTPTRTAMMHQICTECNSALSEMQINFGILIYHVIITWESSTRGRGCEGDGECLLKKSKL